MKNLLKTTTLFCIMLYTTTAFCDLGFRAGHHQSWGKLNTSSNSVKKRSMYTFDLNSLIGWRNESWLLGAFADLRWLNQLTDKAEVSNTNYRGFGYSLGLGAEYWHKQYFFEFDFAFFGRHHLDKVDALNEKVRYYGPLEFRLLFGRKVNDWFDSKVFEDLSFEAQFRYVLYSKLKTGETKSDLEGDDKLKHWSLGLGLSYHY